MAKAKNEAVVERMTVKPVSALIIDSVLEELERLEDDVFGFGEDHADKAIGSPETVVQAKMTEFADLMMAIRKKLAMATDKPH